MKNSRYIIFVKALAFSLLVSAQCKQQGQVMLYNGKGKANTVLQKAVQIMVDGAGSTVSDGSTGRFELSFTTKKAGDRVSFMDMPRAMGYELMNGKALKQWNISKSFY